MSKRMPTQTSSNVIREEPGRTPEARENQMIALAINLAEQQLRDGTASSQVICHYLKLGSCRAKLEQEMLERQNELLAAKTDSLRSAARVEELYSEALQAMRNYSATPD